MFVITDISVIQVIISECRLEGIVTLKIGMKLISYQINLKSCGDNIEFKKV